VGWGLRGKMLGRDWVGWSSGWRWTGAGQEGNPESCFFAAISKLCLAVCEGRVGERGCSVWSQECRVGTCFGRLWGVGQVVDRGRREGRDHGLVISTTRRSLFQRIQGYPRAVRRATGSCLRHNAIWL